MHDKLLGFYARVIGVENRWLSGYYVPVLDIKKDFDKLLHNRLLWKLEHIGAVMTV